MNEKLEIKTTTSLEIFDNIAKYYERYPIIAWLIKQIPIAGTFIEATISTYLKGIIEKRTKIFFDELSEGNIELTEELIKSEDFLFRYFSCCKAAINTRREEKIIFFARLLYNSFSESTYCENEDFEELLSILDELSYREIRILHILDEFEANNPLSNYDENEYTRAQAFWGQFLIKIQKDLGISSKEFKSYQIRLLRTGCYEIHYSGFDASGDKGNLTLTYQKLKTYIQNKKDIIL